jgi:hypothetical protein
MRSVFASAVLLFVAVVSLASSAYAYEIGIDVFLEDVSTGQFLDAAGAFEVNPTAPVFRQIEGSSREIEIYSAQSSGDQFGNVGVAGRLLAGPSEPLKLFSNIRVTSDVLTNPFSTPRAAALNFLIVPGSLEVGGANATALAGVHIKKIHDAGPELFNPPPWEGLVTLVSDASGTLTMTETGFSLGASAPDPLTGEVHIPLSGQTFDLGPIAPGEQFRLEYQLGVVIEVAAGDFAGGSANLGDPFQLSQSPGFEASNTGFMLSGVTFGPAQPVPAPTSLALIALGVGALAVSRRLHHSSASAILRLCQRGSPR